VHILLVIALLLLLVFGPQWWARYTLRRYAQALPILKAGDYIQPIDEAAVRRRLPMLRDRLPAG
jgi:hypothetical protein